MASKSGIYWVKMASEGWPTYVNVNGDALETLYNKYLNDIMMLDAR